MVCFLPWSVLTLYRVYYEEVIEGKFNVNWHPISDIRYVDDTVLVSGDEHNLQKMLVNLKNESEVRGLNLTGRKQRSWYLARTEVFQHVIFT